ncbi:CPBP family intramembrane glutamic endopeptidase [Clostridium sp. B9]|uniref:CPBP family intramembrane glutamic endopeptidase n=1 Tax=Clostridium sp. B9 TaxID=3423224 RepID=UPI003D2EBEE5
MCKRTLFQTLKVVFFLLLLFLFLQFVIALVASFAIMFLVGAISAFMKIPNKAMFIASFEDFTLLLTNCIFQIIALIYFARMYRKRKFNISNIKFEITPKFLGKCTLITFGIGGLSGLWILIVQSLSPFVPFLKNGLADFVSSMSSLTSDPILAFISVVILAPILEEVFFRGIIFNELAKYRQGAFPIILSGLVFGLAHMQSIQSVYTFIMGIILGFVYSKTHSLKIVIFMHMLNNLLSMLPQSLSQFNDILGFICIVPMAYFLIKMKTQKLPQLSHSN